MRKILIVDDEPNVHYSFRRALEGEYEVHSAYDGDEALARLASGEPDVLLLDVRMPRRDGISTLEAIRARHPDVPVVVMTAFGTAETAIRATSLAARDYLLKPVDVPALKKLLREILPNGDGAPQPAERAEVGVDLIGQSPGMQEIGKLIGRAANADATVLITGETGTGKELVARAIHRHGKRHRGPLVAVNCAAIPDNLLESELFGHERGAFTGAERARPGLFERAHGGTVFLDEIGDVDLDFQAKLLRVLQERRVRRVGGDEEREVDVRVVAATNRELRAEVAAGRFREDLYFRLAVVPIVLPPLRERRDDVLPLARSFLAAANAQLGRAVTGFSPEVERWLVAHAWPGNVRELENAIERGVVLASGERLELEDVALGASAKPAPSEPAGEGLQGFLEQAAAERIRKALTDAGGVKAEAARRLAIDRTTLYRLMRRYGID